MNLSLLILFRLTHIVAGILWAGAAIAYLFFVKPSVKAIGPVGPQFMQNMTQRRKYPTFMMATSLLTVLAGLALYWFSSAGLNAAWLRTGAGIGFTLGSLAALAAFVIGAAVIGPNSGKLGALGGQIAASGQPPTPAQLDQLHALEQKIGRAERIEFVLLVVALLTMATARYWTF